MRACRLDGFIVCLLAAHSIFIPAFADTAQEMTDVQYLAFRSSVGVHAHAPHGIAFVSSKKYLVQGKSMQGGCVYSPDVPIDTAQLLASDMEHLSVDLAFSQSTCRLAIEAGYITKKTWKIIEDKRSIPIDKSK